MPSPGILCSFLVTLSHKGYTRNKRGEEIDSEHDWTCVVTSVRTETVTHWGY